MSVVSSLPEGLASYKRTGTFTEASIPPALLRDHATKPGVWGLIRVEHGRLRFVVTDPERAPSDVVLTPDEPGVVEPTIRHHVSPIGPVRFHVEFHRAA